MNAVAIVGGGITGLTAAFRLRQKNIPVTVYESRERVGGVIQTIRQDGYLAEYGPNTLLETSPKISSLIRDAGVEERKRCSDPAADKRYLVRGGRLLPLPASPPAFLSTPLFSLRAKLRLLVEPCLRRAPAEHEESVAEFVVRRLGREFLDYAINPLVGGIYAGDPAQLSVKHAFPKLHAVEARYGSLLLGQILGARERRRRGEISKQNANKLSFDEGLQVLIDALRARLGDAIRLRARVVRLESNANGWSVVTAQGGGESREDHAAVLLAGTAHGVSEIGLPASLGCELSDLAAIRYPPVATVVMGFRREDVAHPLDGFGVLIPEVEKFNILGTLFSSSLFSGRSPAGHVTLTTYVGGTRRPDLATLEPERLLELTRRDLARLLGIKGPPTFQHHVLFRHAIPQYEVGYGRFLDLMNRVEAQAPGVFVAGNFRNGISLSDSIVAGHDTAERMDEFLTHRRAVPPNVSAPNRPTPVHA